MPKKEGIDKERLDKMSLYEVKEEFKDLRERLRGDYDVPEDLQRYKDEFASYILERERKVK